MGKAEKKGLETQSDFAWLWSYTSHRKPNTILELNLSLHSELKMLPESIGRLHNLHTLNLYATGINSLPESIWSLRNLSELNLGATEISKLSESIEKLNNLVKLDISYTNIDMLPQSIGALVNLTYLNLKGAKITVMPDSIGKLCNLPMLDLGGLGIETLPKSIGELHSLKYLNLSRTKICSLPESICNLSNLTALDLSGTNICMLPQNFGALSSLKYLNLSDTKIKSLPNSFGQLKNLESLSLSDTSIHELPNMLYSRPLKYWELSNMKLETISSKILDLNLPFYLRETPFAHKDFGIYLNGTEIAEMDVSMFSRERDSIRMFFREWNESKELLCEARVIFVGNGAVGKSTLIHWMTTGIYKENLPETRGVQLKDWESPNGTTIKTWDFGGQAIMHSMHKFFLGQRCLYVVVLDGRRDEKPEYWLDLISQYGRHCPVLVVMNKIDNNYGAEIDKVKLCRKYENKFRWLAFCETSCKCGIGLEQFRTLFYVGVETLESCKKYFPKAWNSIRKKLLSMPGNYITEKQYHCYCEDSGISSEYAKSVLLEWMNDLGVCFSYHGKSGVVEDTKVLRPEWVLNGVYKIIMAKEAQTSNGFLSYDTIKDILDRKEDVNDQYHNAERDFVLEMMREFKLSYATALHEFIPMLTKAAEPELPYIEDEVRLELEFNECPSEAVLYQLIVEMKYDVKKCWRHGAYFQSNDRSSAIIRFDKDNRKVDFRVSKNCDYLPQLRNTFLRLLAKVNSPTKEYLYYTYGNKTAQLEIGRLMKMLRRGRTTDYADDIDEDINICEVLACIVPMQVIEILKQLQGTQTSSFDSSIKDLLFIMGELKDQITLMCAFVEITSNSMNDFSSLCKKISEESMYNTNQHIQQLLEELLEEVRKGNKKGFLTKLSAFLNTANSVSNLCASVPKLFCKLAQVFQLYGQLSGDG